MVSKIRNRFAKAIERRQVMEEVITKKEFEKALGTEEKIKKLAYYYSEIMENCLNKSVVVMNKLINSDKLEEYIDTSPMPDFTKQFVIMMAVNMATKIYEDVVKDVCKDKKTL